MRHLDFLRGLLVGIAIASLAGTFYFEHEIDPQIQHSNAVIARMESRLRGWTIVAQPEPMESTGSNVLPSGPALALKIMGALSGRGAGALAPQCPAPPAPAYFILPGQVNVMARAGSPLAYFEACDANLRRCSPPAIVPQATPQDIQSRQ